MFAPGVLLAVAASCGHPSTPGTTSTNGGSTSVNGQGGADPSAGGTSSSSTEIILGDAGTGTVGGASPATSCDDAVYSDKFTPGDDTNTSNPEVAALLGRMTMTQKLAQMQGTSTGTADSKNYNDIQRSPDDTENNIRGYMYRDGPHGVNLDARQEGRTYDKNYSTVFPVTYARGASFDLDLEYRIGEAIGDETVATKNTMLLSPCMNILRHPYWGRSQETYGEDVYHLGRMASAHTAGLQTYVAGCAKHYAGNNIENGRANQNALMDEQTLREIYARHFEMVVRDGGVSCIMASYNSINGTKSTQNKHLLTEILRDDFGFKGTVLSDWWAMPPGQDFPSAAQAKQNAIGAVKAGLDIEVPWTMNFAQLQSAVDDGSLTPDDINKAVKHILDQKFRFNSARLDGPFGRKAASSTMVDGSVAGNDAHIELAREAAVKSMVLVKNADGVLPIKTDGSIKTIAVIGKSVDYTLQSTTPGSGTMNFVTDQPLGDRGSSRVNPDPAKVTGPLAGIQAIAQSKSITVTSGSDPAAASSADLTVVVVGHTPGDEGEEYAIPAGGDRASLALSAGQDDFVNQVATAANGKPVIVVIETGGIVNLPWLDKVAAVVMAFYPGQRGGQALAQLLFGEANFSGKMPVAWPKESDLPAFKTSATSTSMDYYIGYRDYDNRNITPIFPFGHGLSYSKFTYSNLQVPCSDVSKGGVVNVTVDIKNESSVAGDEVAFLFTSYPNATARRSKKELKGFYKVSLEANQAKRITIPLRVADLKYWKGDATGAWTIDSDVVNVMVGPDAGHLNLTGSFTVR